MGSGLKNVRFAQAEQRPSKTGRPRVQIPPGPPRSPIRLSRNRRTGRPMPSCFCSMLFSPMSVWRSTICNSPPLLSLATPRLRRAIPSSTFAYPHRWRRRHPCPSLPQHCTRTVCSGPTSVPGGSTRTSEPRKGSRARVVEPGKTSSKLDSFVLLPRSTGLRFAADQHPGPTTSANLPYVTKVGPLKSRIKGRNSGLARFSGD